MGFFAYARNDKTLMMGKLILEDSTVLEGRSFGAEKAVPGEVVFTTGMVGYPESLTDPSYAGQIIVFTYPLIGNYGVPSKETWESPHIHAKGVVMSTLTAHHAHYDADCSLKTWFESEKIPYLTHVDTRALAIRLRNDRVLPGAITSHDFSKLSFEAFDTVHWVKQVSIK